MPIAYLNIYTVPYINIDMINLYVAVIQSDVTLTGGYLLYQNYLSNHDTITGIVKCTFQDIFNLKKKENGWKITPVIDINRSIHFA